MFQLFFLAGFPRSVQTDGENSASALGKIKIVLSNSVASEGSLEKREKHSGLVSIETIAFSGQTKHPARPGRGSTGPGNRFI